MTGSCSVYVIENTSFTTTAAVDSPAPTTTVFHAAGFNNKNNKKNE
jgi:hypothetical protein